MLSQELRPQRFNEVAGQTLAKTTFKNLVKKHIQGEPIPKSMFVYGEYGCGKSTSSRIFARALNCLNPTDSGEPCLKCSNCTQNILECSYYNEYDSSVTGTIDAIRELTDKLHMTMIGKTIVHLFDECHIMSNACQSALLKVIEEAPEGVVFLFATTHPNKVLPTIKSRSLMIEVTLVGRQEIVNNLKRNCVNMGLEVPDSILQLIAMKSKGHMRNAHMLLDSYLLLGDDFVNSQSGARDDFVRYLGAILKKDRTLLSKAIDNLSIRPASTLKEEFDGVLMDLVRLDLYPDPKDPLMAYAKALKPILMKFIRLFNESWVNFENDLTIQTSLMCIYQIMERGN